MATTTAPETAKVGSTANCSGPQARDMAQETGCFVNESVGTRGCTAAWCMDSALLKPHHPHFLQAGCVHRYQRIYSHSSSALSNGPQAETRIEASSSNFWLPECYGCYGRRGLQVCRSQDSAICMCGLLLGFVSKLQNLRPDKILA